MLTQMTPQEIAKEYSPDMTKNIDGAINAEEAMETLAHHLTLELMDCGLSTGAIEEEVKRIIGKTRSEIERLWQN